MQHMMRYMGRYEINFKHLQPNQNYYKNLENIYISVFPTPEGFRGITFFMMEDMISGTAKPVLVMIEDIVLKKPFVVDYERHTGKNTRVGPRGKGLSNECAIRILDDAIKANPDLSKALNAMKKRLG